MDGSKFQLMHTMLRVKDLDKSIDFYTRLLGMKLLRRNEFPEGKFTLAFVGYGPEKDNAVIELTYNGTSPRATNSAPPMGTSRWACTTSTASASSSRPRARRSRASRDR